MNKVLLFLLIIIACTEEFKIIKSNVNKIDKSYSVTTTPIELAVSGMTDIYNYKIFLTLKYTKYPDDSLYLMMVKYQSISLLNLEKGYLEIDGNKIDLTTSRPPIIKQDGVNNISEIYSFDIKKENLLALINENDSRLVLRSGHRIIDIPFDFVLKQKFRRFIERISLKDNK